MARPRQAESDILPQSVERRELRRRALLRMQGVPGYERATPGRKPGDTRQARRERARTPNPDPDASNESATHNDEIAGLLEQLIPKGAARDVIQEWQDEGVRVRFYRGGNRWWIQAHDRHAPVDEFLSTVQRETAHEAIRKTLEEPDKKP